MLPTKRSASDMSGNIVASSKSSSSSSSTTTTTSFTDNENILQQVFAFMGVDTVGLLVTTSNVSRAFHRASTHYLLKNMVPAYKADMGSLATTSGGNAISGGKAIQTREDFVKVWRREQDIFWEAHGVANMPVPTQEEVEKAREKNRYDESALTQQERAMMQAVGFTRNGLPYFPILNPIEENYLFDDRDGMDHSARGTWVADDYWYFLRISRATYGPEWQGIVPLKGFWYPTFDRRGENTHCSGNIKAEKSTDPFLFEHMARGDIIPRGGAVQLRFDLSALPWSKDIFQELHDAHEQQLEETGRAVCVPHVGVVAISKATRECTTIAFHLAYDRWDGDYTYDSASIRHVNHIKCINMDIDFKSGQGSQIQQADFVLLATRRSLDEYVHGAM